MFTNSRSCTTEVAVHHSYHIGSGYCCSFFVFVREFLGILQITRKQKTYFICTTHRRHEMRTQIAKQISPLRRFVSSNIFVCLHQCSLFSFPTYRSSVFIYHFQLLHFCFAVIICCYYFFGFFICNSFLNFLITIFASDVCPKCSRNEILLLCLFDFKLAPPFLCSCTRSNYNA